MSDHPGRTARRAFLRGVAGGFGIAMFGTLVFYIGVNTTLLPAIAGLAVVAFGIATAFLSFGRFSLVVLLASSYDENQPARR